jgi:hypothetical protein
MTCVLEPTCPLASGRWLLFRLAIGKLRRCLKGLFAFGTNVCAPALSYQEFATARPEDLLRYFLDHGDRVTLLSYATLMLVNGRHIISTIRVPPMQLLNGMLFFLTVQLLAVGFYLGWADGGRVTLLGASFFQPYMFLAPLLVGTYLIRNGPG